MKEQIIDVLKPIVGEIVNAHGMYIDRFQYVKHGKEAFLELYVEKEDMSSIDLDEIVSLSDEVSLKLDELDLISDNYTLDVSTSGAEKPIKDFSKFPLLIGKYMQIKVDRAIKGENVFIGTLKEVKEHSIILSYRIKTRTISVEIELENITKANLAVNI